MQIVFAASECAPFIKTGGLGDVVGALPKALAGLHHKVSVMLPKFEDIAAEFKKRMKPIARFHVAVGWRNQYCGIDALVDDGVRYYFLDNEYYFKRHGSYGYFDDGERFAFFSRAVLEALPHLGEAPDIVHCHDWQTGPICTLLKSDYADRPFYKRIHSVFTIHNLKYQGIFPKSVLSDLLGLGDAYFRPDRLEFYGNVSYLKAGLVYADRLTTVSKTYAEEIQQPYFGERLDGLLRWRSGDLCGIVNGIDRERYNPERDGQLAVPLTDVESKAADKAALQSQLGLSNAASVPIVAMITRLTEQKGLDLVLRVFHELMQLNIQFVLLGTGDADYESAFRGLGRRYRTHASVNLFFDDGLARRIYAGSDLFLMPSRFEPCGIGQLIAMRYGSLPVVRETGGLKDTVVPYDELTGEGYGFSFRNYNAHDMLFTIERALRFYRLDKDLWNALVRRAMTMDFGWEASAKLYEQLYLSLSDI